MVTDKNIMSLAEHAVNIQNFIAYSWRPRQTKHRRQCSFIKRPDMFYWIILFLDIFPSKNYLYVGSSGGKVLVRRV